MIKRFKQVEGNYIEKIVGQERFAYAHSDSSDFYDMVGWAERGGYQGSVIIFYDYETGNVYKPFGKKRNVLYSNPAYVNEEYYFLQGDFNEKKITLYRYYPEKVLEKVTELGTDEVNLYNLGIMGRQVHIVSQEDKFECYYPEKISMPLKPNESVILIENGKIYIEAWIEEGWDNENDCATNEYKYYNKIIIKDYEGHTLSEEIGALNQAPDGTWWIS